MVRAFAHGRVDVARAADDDQVGGVEIDQSTEAFGACIRRANDTEPAEEVRWDNLSLGGVLEPMVVVVVAARDLLDDGGIRARQRRRYVALEMCRDARVPSAVLVELPLIGSRPHHNEGADIDGLAVQARGPPHLARGPDGPLYPLRFGAYGDGCFVAEPGGDIYGVRPQAEHVDGDFRSPYTGNQLMRLWNPPTSTGSPRR